MADDERRAEIEAPHEGCLERACECVQDEVASLRRLNQVLAPRHPIVNVPVSTLDAISKRAEDAEAELDRVRDARGDDGIIRPRLGGGWECAPQGEDDAARFRFQLPSPSLADHETGIEAAMEAVLTIRGEYDAADAPIARAAVDAYLSHMSPSRDGTVAVEDVPPIVIEALQAMRAWTYHPPVTPLIRRKREEIDAALAELAPAHPEPDALGGLPPSRP